MRALALLPLLTLAACRQPAPVAKLTEPEVPLSSITHWTSRTELFAEYPPLAAGKVSRFAIHLTRLDNFKAIAKGSVEVRLLRDGRAPETFRAEEPSRPGIFGVDVRPEAHGDYKLSIHFAGEGMTDVHDLGLLKPTQEAEGIKFLKEQQWLLDFATAAVETRSIAASLRVPAEVTARSSGEATVDTPFSGRLIAGRLPAIGTPVTARQVLAQLLLPASAPADPAALDLARSESQALLDLAHADRQRAERLVAAGAAPAKRLEEARTTELTATARVKAAEARLAQYEASTNADGAPAGAKLFALRAPISGVVQAVKAAPGANVKAGETLFQIVDLDTVYVSAIVPEAEFPRMRALSGAELEVPGVSTPQRLHRLVTIGRVVDAPSRTFPVIYEVDNRDRRVAINQTVYVRILFAPGTRAPAIPESALVDDNGQPVVFVQQSGETFAKRTVKLGERSGGYVQALAGVAAGERIVTRGAHLIRLASMSNQVPAHGHVH